MNISKLTDPRPETFRLLVYGEPGVGKTTFAVSGALHPDLGPAALLNIDMGTEGITAPERFDNALVTVDGLHTLQDVADALTEFTKTPDKRNPALVGVKTIILDTVSQLMQNLLTGQATVKATSFEQRMTARRELQMYGTAMNAILLLIDQLTIMGYNMIVVAQEKETANGQFVPDVPPATLRSLQSRFSYIWRMARNAQGQIAVRCVPQGAGFEMLKTRNATFQNALAAHTNANGWLILPEAAHEGLAQVYNIYKESK